MRSATYRDSKGLYRCTECGLAVDMCLCIEADDLADERLHSTQGAVFRLIRDELQQTQHSSARDKTLIALGGAYGAFCQIMLAHDRDGNKTAIEVLRAAVQMATLAIHVATEGDVDFTYEFPHPGEH